MTNKLNEIKGQELKYKQLCEKLNLKIKYGNSKVSQLKDLELYCKFNILSSPTRYVVTEVYNEKDLPIHGNNKFQEPIETIIISLLQLTNYQNLYITNTQLLMSLYMVNSNYKILKIPRLRRALENSTGQDYYDLYLSAAKSGEILTKWVDRALKRMDGRGLIAYRKGFCLVKKLTRDNFTYYQKYNVPLTGEIEQRILGCYNQALDSLNLNKESKYIPNELKTLFSDRFNQLIREEFNGEYDSAYRVNVITPADPKRIKRFDEVRNLLNGEAQRKIKDTKQLDYLTGVERKRLLDEIIAITPSIEYEKLIKNEIEKE